jgi:hypothetical protein
VGLTKERRLQVGASVHLAAVLLVSAPVYWRTQQDRAAAPPGSHFRWPVPPAWVVLGGLAGGAVVTVLYLGSMNWQPMPGCGRRE